MDKTLTIDGAALIIVCDAPAPTLPDLDHDLWREAATEMCSDEIDSCYRYDLGDGQSLYVDCLQGDPETCCISEDTLLAHMLEWHSNALPDNCDAAQWLASWDLDACAALEQADPDYDGDFRVWCEPNFHPATCNAPSADYARDDGNEILEFATHAEAQAYVDSYFSEPSCYDGILQCNVLSHGQAGSDTLTIVQAG